MIASTPTADNFGQLQVGDLVYLNNRFGMRTGQSAETQWLVPVGSQLGFRCYELPVPGSPEDTNECKLCWRINENPQDLSYVRGYPSILLGTLDGRDSSWGIGDKTGCDLTPKLAGTGRCGSSAIFDMRAVKAATGFPVKVPDMEPIEICFHSQEQCSGQPGLQNTFIDTYFDYIGDPALWPAGYQAAWGDENKINGNATKTWNLNFWYCYPSDPVTQWTGGKYLATRTLGSVVYDFYCKHENNPHPWNNGCTDSGFFYIAAVPVNRQFCNQPVCLDYNSVADWITSQDFKNTVLSSADCLQVWNDLGQPPFIVDQPQNFMLNGLQVGWELWQNQDITKVTCNSMSDLRFKVGDRTFGKSRALHSPQIAQPRPWTPGQSLNFEGGELSLVATGPNMACVQ